MWSHGWEMVVRGGALVVVSVWWDDDGRLGGGFLKFPAMGVQDVHETAVGALWNLVFNPGNALRMVEEEGVPALVHLCSSSRSKMARFMAALALAYMFDGR